MRYFLLFFLILHTTLSAQFRQVGTWRYYINHQQYADLENVENNLFINAKRLLFDVKVSSFEINSYEKTTGLADYSIATIGYHSDAKKLLVVYENSSIDIIDFKNGEKRIVSNFDITNKLIVADKTVDGIKFFRDRAYLCSRLGVIVYNYDRNEMEANYIIGDNGEYLPVHTLEILNNKIYASTPKGIKVGEILPAINLQDYNNWSLPISFIPNDTFYKSNQLGSKTYWMSNYSFYEMDNSSSTLLIPKDTLRRFVQLRKIENDLYLLYDSFDINKDFVSSKVLKFDGSQFTQIKKTKGKKLYDINQVDGKFYFTGDGQLFTNQDGDDLWENNLNSYPWDNPFRLMLNGKNLIISMGVMPRYLDASLNKDGHWFYGELPWAKGKNNWHRFGIWGDSLSKCTNELSVIERDGGKYRAFFRGGVVFEKEGSPIKRFGVGNSTLDTSTDFRITDMVYDSLTGHIWIANLSAVHPLKCLTKENKWYSFDLTSVTNTNQIYKIIIDQSSNKWLLTREDGVILFNEKELSDTTDDIVKRFVEIKAENSTCKLDILKPFSGVVDRENTLWIGTEKGIGSIRSCTYDAEDNCDFYIPAQQIKNPNDTTSYTECAFLNTAVTALAVDGGNHLWIGTPDGIFYNQEDLGSELMKLNKLNSSFSAKSIYDILVHPVSGEVFMTTDVGLLSYMGQSVDAAHNADLSPYRVIPNPYPRDYDGLMTIDGLEEKAFFKITDVVGNLMYQGESNGGRVTWDTRTLTGQKVPTGVYYIFSNQREMRGKSAVGSFTVIR